MFVGVVTIVFTGGAGMLLSLLTAVVSGVVSPSPFPPQDITNKARAAEDSRPANLDRFIDFDFNFFIKWRAGRDKEALKVGHIEFSAEFF
jgi:hypothetical protein